MKYQALRPHLFSVGGWLEGTWGGWVGGLWCGSGWWVVGWVLVGWGVRWVVVQWVVWWWGEVGAVFVVRVVVESCLWVVCSWWGGWCVCGGGVCW